MALRPVSLKHPTFCTKNVTKNNVSLKGHSDVRLFGWSRNFAKTFRNQSFYPLQADSCHDANVTVDSYVETMFVEMVEVTLASLVNHAISPKDSVNSARTFLPKTLQ